MVSAKKKAVDAVVALVVSKPCLALSGACLSRKIIFFIWNTCRTSIQHASVSVLHRLEEIEGLYKQKRTKKSREMERK